MLELNKTIGREFGKRVRAHTNTTVSGRNDLRILAGVFIELAMMPSETLHFHPTRTPSF